MLIISFFRIGKIAERFGVDPGIVLENISYARALNSEHQMELIEEIGASFSDGSYRLLVIDSIMALFRVDVCSQKKKKNLFIY